jgi:hypothetical protein
MDYSLLDWLAPTPRTLTGDVENKIAEIYSKPFFSSFRAGALRTWRDEVSAATYVLAGVVHASASLRDPTSESSSGGGVFVWTLDARFVRDPQWIGALAARLYALRSQPSSDPALSRLGALLNDEQSSFFEALPSSITDGVAAHWAVGTIFRSDLPDGVVPESRVIPAFFLPRGSLKFVPASLYGREKK